jgi:hypothetical protein
MRAVSIEANAPRHAGLWPRWFAILLALLVCGACALTLCAAVAANAWPRLTGPIALAAFGLGGVAWLVRGAAFFAGRWRPHARSSGALAAARWVFAVLFFPLPGWLLGWGGGSHAAFWAALGLQLAGLAAERWASFAEARAAQAPGRPEAKA